MRKTTYPEPADTASLVAETQPPTGGLPNRLLTAFEVAEFVGWPRRCRVEPRAASADRSPLA